MVEVIKTATEAKTVALRELDIRSRFSGDLATGTLTDSVAVGCTKRGEPIQYAGTFTILGELIGMCVRKGVKIAIFKQENISPKRTLIERLADRCLPLETIIYRVFEGKITKESPKYKQLKKQIELILSDDKIAKLVIATLRLDEDLAKGLIPEKNATTVDSVLFEEIVQTALKCQTDHSLEFGINKSKLDSEAQLGPFTRCVLEAIAKNAESNMI